MFWFLFVLGVLTLLLGIFPIVLTLRLNRYFDRALNEAIRDYTPKVSLILPCKGIDPGFEKNIEALLTLDYPDYEAIFVTATDDDPAYLFLENLFQKNSHTIPVKLITAGISPVRGQKINNMLKAIKEVHAETKVYAFVDSDIRPEKNFLMQLVQPLQKKEVGVTTGIRWYLPQKKNIGSLLQAIWAAGAYPLLIDQKHNFAWGGANAIKVDTFEQADVAGRLEFSISDTFAITNGVKNIGLQVHFVPQCIVVSHENSTLIETIEWTNRQTIISRVYSPSFWWMVFITYSFSNTMLIIGFVTLMVALTNSSPALFIPSFLMLSLIPLEMLNAALLIPSVKKVLFRHQKRLDELSWPLYLATPLTSILIMVNSIYSLTTNEITWRGVRYKLVSPTETTIL